MGKLFPCNDPPDQVPADTVDEECQRAELLANLQESERECHLAQNESGGAYWDTRHC